MYSLKYEGVIYTIYHTDSLESNVHYEDIQPELYSELGITFEIKNDEIVSRLDIYYLQCEEKSNSFKLCCP
jgi:hypothetical protein